MFSKPVDPRQNDNIKVILRIRPKTEREFSKKTIPMMTTPNSITITTNKDKKTFNFDYVAPEETSQSEMFENAAKEICDKALEGYNGTIFVYGQTGAGKTYTLLGPSYSAQDFMMELNKDFTKESQTKTSIIERGFQNIKMRKEEEGKGILPRVLEYIFTKADQNASEDDFFQFSCSFLEIYNEQIADLFDYNSNKAISIRENNGSVVVDGLKKKEIFNIQQALDLIKVGSQFRHIASTNMNKESSRSHAVFSFYITHQTKKEGVATFKKSVFHLIDLAGSERQKSTECTGERIKEAGKINKSLMQLSHVIKNLSEAMTKGNKGVHIHYRDSKLTHLLKDSLGGNSKTCIICNISPSIDCMQESISTLNFAQSAKLIKNKAVINEVKKENLNGGDLLTYNEYLKLKEKYENMKQENDMLISLLNNSENNPPLQRFGNPQNGFNFNQFGNNSSIGNINVNSNYITTNIININNNIYPNGIPQQSSISMTSTTVKGQPTVMDMGDPFQFSQGVMKTPSRAKNPLSQSAFNSPYVPGKLSQDGSAVSVSKTKKRCEFLNTAKKFISQAPNLAIPNKKGRFFKTISCVGEDIDFTLSEINSKEKVLKDLYDTIGSLTAKQGEYDLELKNKQSEIQKKKLEIEALKNKYEAAQREATKTASINAFNAKNVYDCDRQKQKLIQGFEQEKGRLNEQIKTNIKLIGNQFQNINSSIGQFDNFATQLGNRESLCQTSKDNYNEGMKELLKKNSEVEELEKKCNEIIKEQKETEKQKEELMIQFELNLNIMNENKRKAKAIILNYKGQMEYLIEQKFIIEQKSNKDNEDLKDFQSELDEIKNEIEQMEEEIVDKSHNDINTLILQMKTKNEQYNTLYQELKKNKKERAELNKQMDLFCTSTNALCNKVPLITKVKNENLKIKEELVSFKEKFQILSKAFSPAIKSKMDFKTLVNAKEEKAKTIKELYEKECTKIEKKHMSLTNNQNIFSLNENGNSEGNLKIFGLNDSMQMEEIIKNNPEIQEVNKTKIPINTLLMDYQRIQEAKGKIIKENLKKDKSLVSCHRELFNLKNYNGYENTDNNNFLDRSMNPLSMGNKDNQPLTESIGDLEEFSFGKKKNFNYSRDSKTNANESTLADGSSESKKPGLNFNFNF
ncbi:MAG: hypothetical protein MJ252_08905 [archaeon]|nr:hypothetical protein [archaeon]